MVRYRADIDGLRAIAILPVVLYHAGIPGFSGGFVGVDVFFVISSYLITSILLGEIERGTFSFLSFYERRARRILPALTAVILASFALGSLVLLSAEMDALGKSAFAAALFASNIHFAMSQGYFAPAAELAPLLHTWSLAVEEQFYLFFPPVLLLLLRAGGRNLVTLVLLALTSGSFGLTVLLLASHPGWTFYLLPFRAWELGVGALLALAPTANLPSRRVFALVPLLGLAAILLPVVFYGHATRFPGPAALPPVLGTALLIWTGSSRGPVERLLTCRVMTGIGLISYSLYLWHWPLMAFQRSWRGSVHIPLWLGIVAVAVSILLAVASYVLLERPFRRPPPRGFGRRTIFATSIASLAATACIGASLALNDGAPGRLPHHVRSIAAAADDTNPRRKSCFERMPRDGLCRLGENTSRDEVDFLLWGDSHALALMPGLDLAARNAGLGGLFVGHSACLPVPGLRRVPENRACTDLNAAVMRFLAQRDDLPLVILSGRWTLAVEGSRFGEEPGERVLLEHTSDRIAALGMTEANNATLLQHELGRTLATLRTAGREVLILGPVPEPGWDVPLRLARAGLAFGRPAPPPLSREDYLARAGRTESLLARLAEQTPGTRYASLSPLFCKEHCEITHSDGTPLYADDDHPTRRAALTLLPEPMAPILAAANR